MQLYTQRAMDTKYWNEYMETMSREQLDKLHLKRIQGMIKYAYAKVPMYRKLYDEAGLKPEDVKTLEDYIYKVPAIDKADVVRAQGLNPPYGDAIVQNSEEYVSLFYSTSGSTGKPMLEPGNYKDIQNLWTFQWWAHGMRPKDKFYFAFPFGTFMAFWSAYYDALLMGAEVISAGGMDTKGRVLQIMDLKPTVLVATPTYALRIAEVAREMGIDMRESSVKWVSTAGESGSIIPSIREAMERAWNAEALDLYGISELWGSTNWQCPVHKDRMHMTETSAYGIVLDGDGQLVPDGGTGEYVLTSYGGSIQPLIKYRTHDSVSWNHEYCSCGRTWMWLQGGVLGRTDQMVTIKGTNVYPTGVQAILGEIEGLSEHVEIHIYKAEDGDAVTVKVEPKDEVLADQYAALQQKAIGELHRKIGVRLGVEIMQPKSLPRYEQKAKRVFDNRK